jgi:hypothetical protein
MQAAASQFGDHQADEILKCPGNVVAATTNPSQARSTNRCSSWSAMSLALPTTARAPSAARDIEEIAHDLHSNG